MSCLRAGSSGIAGMRTRATSEERRLAGRLARDVVRRTLVETVGSSYPTDCGYITLPNFTGSTGVMHDRSSMTTATRRHGTGCLSARSPGGGSPGLRQRQTDAVGCPTEAFGRARARHSTVASTQELLRTNEVVVSKDHWWAAHRRVIEPHRLQTRS